MRFTAGTKFSGLILLCILLIGLAGATGLIAQQQVGRQLLGLNPLIQSIQTADDLQFKLSDLRGIIEEAIARQDAAWLQERIDLAAPQVDATSRQLIELLAEQGDHIVAEVIESIRATLTQQLNDLGALARQGDWNGMERLLNSQFDLNQQRLRSQLELIHRTLQQDASDATASLRQSQRQALIRLASFSIGSLIILGLAVWLLWRNLIKPIARLTADAEVLGQGSLSLRTGFTRRSDEIGVLARSFNTMADQLENLYQSLSDQVAARTDELEHERLRLQQALIDLHTGTAEREHLLAALQDVQHPLIPISAGILALPLIGQLTVERLEQAQHSLLQRVQAEQTETVLIDITGVPVLDQETAQELLETGQMLRLLGAIPILVGISPEVAQALVELHVDLSDLETAATMQSGIALALGAEAKVGGGKSI